MGESWAHFPVTLALLYLKGKSEKWAEEAGQAYAKKISAFFKFERIAVKSKSAERESANRKKEAEAVALLKHIDKSDEVVLFDEHGKKARNSIEFSSDFVKIVAKQNRRIVFVIGGPYGFSDEIKIRAQNTLCLSDLTMNHHVAQIVALEQIYRALTIWKRLPYHNE